MSYMLFDDFGALMRKAVLAIADGEKMAGCRVANQSALCNRIQFDTASTYSFPRERPHSRIGNFMKLGSKATWQRK